MMNTATQESRVAATMPAQDRTDGLIRRIWHWLTGYSLSSDEVIRMTLLYTEIL